MELLVERNERTDFSAAGVPTAAAIAKIVDFKVHPKEISVVWQQYHEAKAAQ
jgi:hypothetical protein